MTRLHLLLAKSGKLELNQVQYSDTNRERGTSDLSSRRWAALADNFAVGAHVASSTFFLGCDGAAAFCRYGRAEPSFRFLLQSVTDAGRRSGHCNELISARRNPPSWVVNLHQIGSSVLPPNLIHPTAVVYRVQGPRALLTVCTSCVLSLLLFVSAKGSLWATASRSGRYRASCPPPGCVRCYHSYRSLLRGSPLYLRRCRLAIHDPLVDQMRSPART